MHLHSTLLLFVVTGTALAQGTASGTLTIGKDKFELKYSAATLVPDSFDKSKTQTRVVLSDKPVPEDLLDDEAQIWDLKTKGYHGIQVDFPEDRKNYSLVVISSTLSGSFSNSGTFDEKRLTVFTKTRVEGSLEAPVEEHFGNTVGYSVKFATNIKQPEAAPTAADATAAAGKESTKAYLALVEAIRAGNKQKILELAPPDQRAVIDTPEFPKMLKMVQEMTPKNIKVLKATENGDHATLLASGTSEGKPQRGKVYLNRVNGKWIMGSETWKDQ